ncbi:MAG: gamma-glutamyltransferase [Sandaracinaceae bacterium]|nr:gamma-glutamyltransferase [Sandaracinaceae bacterium]
MRTGPRALWLALLVVLAIGAPWPGAHAYYEEALPQPPSHAASFTRHAVAADHPLASEAGARVLAQGGNAADAVVATALALGVVSPASSGLGGGGFALYYRASDHTVTFLDFREEAPSAASPTTFVRREGDTDVIAAQRSQIGGLAVAVPGEPLGLETMLERFGSHRVTRRRIAEPAAQLAQAGWPASRYTSTYAAPMLESLRADRVLGAFLPPGAERLEQGSTLRNAALAHTIRRFGAEGARPFYRGAIARAIAREVQRRGGVITAADLAAYRVRERVPLEGVRFGRRWVVAPPPSAGGFTMLESLGLLERWMPHPHEGARFRHALAESWKGAFRDRALYAGDPDFVTIPVDRLLDAARLDARAQRFDRFAARAMADYDVPGESFGDADATPRDHGTSHVCVVDAEGNVASLTTTVNLPFGARFTVEGMVMNDQMDDFARELGAPNAFGLPGGSANLPGPHHRPVSTMSPTIVFDGAQPILCVGGSGGSRIVTAAEQVALFQLLLGDDAGAAVRRARVHHQGMPTGLSYEQALDPRIVAGLVARGHEVSPVETSANVQTIRIHRDPSSGAIRLLDAASDLRKDGEPRGL